MAVLLGTRGNLRVICWMVLLIFYLNGHEFGVSLLVFLFLDFISRVSNFSDFLSCKFLILLLCMVHAHKEFTFLIKFCLLKTLIVKEMLVCDTYMAPFIELVAPLSSLVSL